MMDRQALYLQALEADSDRALSSRFAMAEKRTGLWLLCWFDGELATIGRRRLEPTLRALRYQFWRESLSDPQGAGHAAVIALRTTFTDHAPLFEGLQELVDTHESGQSAGDQQQVSIAAEISRQTLLFRLADLWLADSEARADVQLPEEAGAAYGTTLHLVRPGWRDRLSKGARAGMIETAENHFEAARSAFGSLPLAVRPAYLPLALLPSYFRLLTKPGAMESGPIVPHHLRRLFVLWRAARRGL